MARAAQLLAMRRNAEKSTGPRLADHAKQSQFPGPIGRDRRTRYAEQSQFPEPGCFTTPARLGMATNCSAMKRGRTQQPKTME